MTRKPAEDEPELPNKPLPNAGPGSLAPAGSRWAEADLIDWFIRRPDGTEEENVVGTFLDERQRTRRAK